MVLVSAGSKYSLVPAPIITPSEPNIVIKTPTALFIQLDGLVTQKPLDYSKTKLTVKSSKVEM